MSVERGVARNINHGSRYRASLKDLGWQAYCPASQHSPLCARLFVQSLLSNGKQQQQPWVDPGPWHLSCLDVDDVPVLKVISARSKGAAKMQGSSSRLLRCDACSA